MGTLWKYAITVFMLLTVPCVARSDTQPAPSGAAVAKTGTFSGRILTTGGEPLSGGTVCFFNTRSGPPPAHEKYWRVPDYTKRIDSDGKFLMVLPEGEYYMGATMKISGKTAGPPREGDFYFISSDDKGIPLTYGVKTDARIDLGSIAKAVPFRSSTVYYGEGITAINGVVLDREGKPVADAFVFAFVTAVKGARPLFIAEPTGKDGTFTLRVHDAGTYYLRVRSVYGGGPPQPGEMIGFYGEKQPVGITIKRGKRLTGLTIRAASFAGRGPQNRANGFAQGQEVR